MSTGKTRRVVRVTPKAKAESPKKVNLFAKAEKAAVKPVTRGKRPKGTMIKLPETGDGAEDLNQCVSDIISAKVTEKKAKNRVQEATGNLMPHVRDEFALEYAGCGRMPSGPITVVNDKDESLTLIVQDKTQTNKLSDEQVAAMVEVVGEDVTQRVVTTQTIFSFNSQVLAEPVVVNGKAVRVKNEDGSFRAKTVGDVLAEVVTKAVTSEPALAEVAENLIVAETITRLKPGVLNDLCNELRSEDDEYVDAETIDNFMAALGGNCVTYFKA